MPFDTPESITSAVDTLSEGLGLGLEQPEEVTAPVVEPSPPAAPASPSPSPAAPAAPPVVAAPVVPTPPAATPAPAPTDLNQAPKTWRPEAIADWNKLPPSVRAEVHKREEDMFRGLEAYKGDANLGKSVQQVLAPYLPTLRQYNIDPMAQISGLMQAHQTLALGAPEQKLALFQKLATDYGIDISKINGGAPAAAPGEPPFIDPAVKSLQDEVQAVKTHLQQTQQAQQARVVAEQRAEVDKFAADPKNVHFQIVANDMVNLIQKGVASSLQHAYELAVWNNPVSRQAEISRQAAEAQSKAEAEAKAHAEAAKAATAANVRTRAKSGSAAAPQGSMADTLRDTYKSIAARGT